MHWRTIVGILFILSTTLIVAGCAGSTKGTNVTAFQNIPSVKPGSAKSASIVSHRPKYAEIGPLQLQAAMMSLADTTNARTAEAAMIVERIGTPQARLTAARMMVYDIAANVEIASGPYPGVALLDLIVLTSLRRMVWEDYWVNKLGPEAEPALEHFREIEEEVWEDAAKVMTREQLEELAKTIQQWRKKHPKQISVNYVRFNDFGDLGLKPSMRRLIKPGGLFASVQEAAVVAQDMKVAIDRAFYLMSRMQLVINGQVKLAYLELMFQPESEDISVQTDRMASITERYAEIAESLPAELGGETSKLVNQLFAQLNKNTESTLTTLFNGMTLWQKQTILDLSDKVSTERQAAIKQAIDGLTAQQNQLYDRADALVERSGDEFKENLDYAIKGGMLLLVTFFVLLSLYKIFVARPIDKRQS
ncbi:hypothetical protein [Pseudodesulfovibrio sp. zrk46]|uniref:hypothetical protein n=1 Tax=Pseudodesulfovibrio sp. zrk46 TaxID=2725288 RepID=UPI00144A054E|nr:hypothetical protein [Pseudodesulfovibrio sp. zrk46]QJB55244.1 hypothetical protein HFN16_01985 [Pseudodesulfovibrio sp. zrk46]